MQKSKALFLLLLFIPALACQYFASSDRGLRVAACSETVLRVRNIQPRQVPEHLLRGGQKQGDEFDVNQYFSALTRISMRDGYILDYVYQLDNLGGYPLLYARPADQAPYASIGDIPQGLELTDFQEYLDVEDTEQGYFEYVVMDIMSDQFYLFWHANYNDSYIVCNRQQVYDIVAQIDSGELGNVMEPDQRNEARALKNITPVVLLTGDTAVMEIVTFTKWGGFYRLTYTISREAPHTIIEIKQENILPYDCGVVF